MIPSRIDLAKTDGYFYVEDVYVGTGMERIERGTVKSLRVVESPEKRFWTGPAWDGGTGQQAPGMAWNDFNNKRILGTVPVEADGSAYFAVPADTFVYFQLLDEQGLMVQSMRSGTIVRPGETSGCVGCHESRRSSARAAVHRPGVAHAGREPLQPWYGPPRLFSYTAEVQPAFDKHCVSCHDYGKDAGKKLNLAGDLGLIFNTSYVELRQQGLGPRRRGRPHGDAAAEVLGLARQPPDQVPAGRPRQPGDRPAGEARPRRASTGSSPGSTSTPRTIRSTRAAPIATTSTAARRWTATN